jgi:predicted GH43/DUF377 family glycosyl hydrolase
MKSVSVALLGLAMAACGGGAAGPQSLSVTQSSSAPVTVSAPVISPTQPWEGNNIEDGSTVKVGTTYYRFYCAGSWPGQLNIGYATATQEGFPFNWTKFAGNPIIHASDFYSGSGKAVCAPRVLSMPDGSYRMYVHAFDGTHDRGYLLIAAATDFPNVWTNVGETFRESSGWEGVTIQTHAIIPSFESPDDLYHLFYAGFDGSAFRGGHATSADGISNWQRDTANPIMDQGGSGWRSYGVLPGGWFKKDGGFYILAQGFDGKKWSIGYYSSTDLKTFIPSDNPILTGSSGQWNAMGIESGDAFVDGTNTWLFYVGTSLPTENATYRIGVARLN